LASLLPPVLFCVYMQRYRALFALRNKGGEAAVAVLGEAFGATSALLKHEVAYVMGQMQHPASAGVLCKVLQVSLALICRRCLSDMTAPIPNIRKPSLMPSTLPQPPLAPTTLSQYIMFHLYAYWPQMHPDNCGSPFHVSPVNVHCVGHNNVFILH
jgi:hypothetical protein